MATKSKRPLKTSRNFRLTAEAFEILNRLSLSLGVTETAIVEMAIRKMDKAEAKK